MKLIVDVPHSLYANLSTIKNESVAGKRVLECVKHGTPLSKGHGRLIDAVEREERLEILLYNAIDMLLAKYDNADILDNIGMTLDEYNQVMKADKEE